MMILCADKTRLAVRELEPVTSWPVYASKVCFEFSEDWDGLFKTALFQAGRVIISVPLDRANACVIPWAVLTEPGRYLMAGVYGRAGDTLVLPTVWACLGMILEGSSHSADFPPTPELWQMELDRKGDRLAHTAEGELGLYSGDTLLSSVPGGGAAPVEALTNLELKEILK